MPIKSKSYVDSGLQQDHVRMERILVRVFMLSEKQEREQKSKHVWLSQKRKARNLNVYSMSQKVSGCVIKSQRVNMI